MPQESERQLLRASKPRLRVIDDDALNAESAPGLLDGSPLTPVPLFFIRNNGLLPSFSPDEAAAWTLSIDGEVERPRHWTIESLKASFPVVDVTAVLECAGNGRVGYSPPTDGLIWTNGAVGCARWTGVRLADLLEDAGLKSSAVYTGHESPDPRSDGSGRPAISRGLPIAKALSPECLVAFAMNGEPLPFLHGGPLRIVAPGYPGSAWQKWLTRIRVRDREHDGEKMNGTDYRLPTIPVAPGQEVDPSVFAVITDIPVRSMITSPEEGFRARPGGMLAVRGFAWSGSSPVARVDVSADGGGSWQEASLEAAAEPFAWRSFEAQIEVARAGEVTLMARATDALGRAQPLGSAPWNPRGYCNNGVHRVHGSAA